jgi:ElaB/YqjD/DUF883 family membrane-anchored ribosome-binding protein
MKIKDTVQDVTNDVFETAEEKLGAFADRAYETGRQHAEEAVSEQKNAFKRFILTMVRAMRRGGEELREEGYATVAGVVDDVASKTEEMTDSIDDLDMRSATDRIEDFVRERPLVAYGALALAGFVVANTLQAAASRNHGRAPAPRVAAKAPAARSTAARKPAARRPASTASKAKTKA